MKIKLYYKSASHIDIKINKQNFYILPCIWKFEIRNIRKKKGKDFDNSKHLKWFTELSFFFMCFRIEIKIAIR